MKNFQVSLKKIFLQIHIPTIFLFLLIGLLLTFQLGKNPLGLFCDEAIIGYRAYEISQGKFINFYNPFFYKHFSYAYGTLPVYATLPFVALFGLSDFSVRFASVFFSFSSLLVIFLILKTLSVQTRLFPVVLFALNPLFFHFSRVNFGQLPPLFFLLLGYYLFLLSKTRGRLFFSIVGGVFLGISFYGYSGFLISGCVFLATIVVGEIFLLKNNFEQYKYLVLFSFSALLFLFPIIYFGRNNPEFFRRLREKTANQTSFFSVDKIKSIMANYPKYYTYDFLFRKGEIDLPGAFITRHSVRGNGAFFKVTLLLIVLSFVFFIFDRRKKKMLYLPFFLLLFLYPAPDIITTRKESPPYSVLIFATIFFLPFLAAYALDFLDKTFSSTKYRRRKLCFLSLASLIFILEAANFLKNYQVYPTYSSDYWGWQYGPSKIINYFQKVKGDYDGLYLTGYFNEPEIFFSFYDPDHLCKNCFVGGIDNFDPNKKQLFAFRSVEVTNLGKLLPNYIFNSISQVSLPDGRVEYQIGSFRKK